MEKEASSIPLAPLEQHDTRSLNEFLEPKLTERVFHYLLFRAEAIKTMANAQSANAQSNDNGKEQHGIEETIDILEAAEETALEIIEQVLDGVDPMDAVQVVLDGDVRDTWAKAAQGASQVDEEVADLSREEAFDLVRKGTDVSESIFQKVTS
jgi:hypothetical protein